MPSGSKSAKLGIEDIKQTLKRLREQKGDLEAKLLIRKTIDKMLSLMSREKNTRKVTQSDRLVFKKNSAINTLSALSRKKLKYSA